MTGKTRVATRKCPELSLTLGEVVELETTAGHVLAAAAGEVDAIAPSDDEPRSSADLAEHASGLVASLPVPLLRAAHRFRAVGSPHDVLLVRGLEFAGTVQETPRSCEPGPLRPAARSARLMLVAVAGLVGEPFTFADLYGGRLVQHVVPVPGRERAQTSEGSDSVLDWHVEDAHSPLRCDYFGLLAVRGDPTAATRLAPVRAAVAQLDAEQVHVLRGPRFVIAADAAHTNAGDGDLAWGPVLTGPNEDPELCFDAIYQRPARATDAAAEQALRALVEALDAVAVDVVLEPGDLVLVDNRRVAHARTAFTPCFDGHDRWLMRVMVCASGRTHRRRRGSRALDTLQEG